MDSAEGQEELVGIDNRGADYGRKHKRKRNEVEKSVAVTPEDLKKERKRKRKETRGSVDTTREAINAPQDDEIHAEPENRLTDGAGLSCETEERGKQKKRKLSKTEKVGLSEESKRSKPRKTSATSHPESHVSSAAKPNDHVDDRQTDQQPGGEVTRTIKPKSHKKRKTSGQEAQENDKPIAAENDASLPKKKSKSKQKQKQKHAKSDSPEPNADPDVSKADAEKSRKRKRKHRDVDLHGAETFAPEEPSSTRKKKKRSLRKDTCFADPSADSTLSDSARKALSYAYVRVSAQPDWKFNKARQNWLIRNVWDEAAIPEIYFPSCVEYLSDVQGNTRELLIKSTATLLDPIQPEEKNQTTLPGAGNAVAEPKKDGGTGGESSEDKARRLRLKRARAMLVALNIGS